MLRVVTDVLELSQRQDFLMGCQRLLASEMEWLIVDMRGLRRIFSIFVGTVMDVNARVRGEGRRLTIIASEDVGKLFRTLVGPETLEICQPESELGVRSKRKSSRTIRRPSERL